VHSSLYHLQLPDRAVPLTCTYDDSDCPMDLPSWLPLRTSKSNIEMQMTFMLAECIESVQLQVYASPSLILLIQNLKRMSSCSSTRTLYYFYSSKYPFQHSFDHISTFSPSSSALTKRTLGSSGVFPSGYFLKPKHRQDCVLELESLARSMSSSAVVLLCIYNRAATQDTNFLTVLLGPKILQIWCSVSSPRALLHKVVSLESR
jgi:hypothetical protein